MATGPRRQGQSASGFVVVAEGWCSSWTADRLRGAHSTVVDAGTERASSTAAVGSHLLEQQNNPKNLLSRLPIRPAMRNPTTTLTPSQRAAFDQLTQHVDADSEPISSETAVAYITDGRFERLEAQELLEQLLLKGYLYESTDGLKITK